MEKVSQKYTSTPFQKWRRKGTLQGTEPKARQLGQCLFKKHSLSSELGDLEASFQREFRNLWTSDFQVPPVPPPWNGRIIPSILTVFHCYWLGVWGQTICLSISNSKGSRSREAISMPDGDHRILAFKADSMIRCDLWGSGESKNPPACQREVDDGGVNSGWCEDGLRHVTFDDPPLWVSSAPPLDTRSNQVTDFSQRDASRGLP